MLRTIVLHGEARRLFGDRFRFDVETVGEAGRALASQIDGFRAWAVERRFRAVAGPMRLGHDDLTLRLGGLSEIHIEPVVDGAGGGGSGKGIGKVILGIALIGASFFIPAAGIGVGGLFTISASNVALFGVSMALRGVASLFVPTPQTSSSAYTARERPEQRPSFIFDGPVNTVEQGGAIPVVYGGPIRVGSVAVSGGLAAEQI